MLASKNIRRPFGTSAGNGANNRDSGPGRKDGKSVEPRGSKVTSKAFQPGQGRSLQRAAQKNDDRDDKRRKSKTPKTNNLSSIGGAYDIQNNFVERSVIRDVTKKSEALPDPSPIRRPDPTSMYAPTRDSFVTSSVQRLFNPSRSKIIAGGRKTIDSSKHSERSMSSDMDTNSSNSDKNSPLITSPYEKPDPDAFHLSIIKNNGCRKEMNKSSNSKVEEAPGVELDATKIQSAKNEKHAISKSKSQLQPNFRLEEAMVRARNGPTDNTRVLAAMLNSCSGKSKCRNDSTHTEASGVSLVGSTVGGASLQRSASADESEVTIQDCTSSSHTSKVTGASDVLEKYWSRSNPTRTPKNQQNNVHASSNDLSSASFVRRPTSVERKTLSDQVVSQLRSGYTFPSQIHLPAGWQVRISKSKGKPYYVHPDFGSTWHYPGLIIGHHIAVQNELHMDQSIDVSKFTSLGSLFQKTKDASSEMRSTTTMETSRHGTISSFGHEMADHLVEQQTGAGASVSSGGKQTDASVLLETSIDSKSVSSNASQSKCLTQDSNANYNETVALSGSGKEAREKIALENNGGVNSAAELNENSSDNLVDFQTEYDDLESFDVTSAINRDDALSAIGSAHIDGINSLTSDHVDVDALLRHGTQRNSSPLVTIKETIRESSGRQSSQVSLDDASVDVECVQVRSSRTSSEFQSLCDDWSNVSEDVDKSVVNNAHAGALEDGNDFDNYGSGFDDHDDNGSELERNDTPRFDKYHVEALEHGPENEAEAATKRSKKRAKSAPIKRRLRKTFPAGSVMLFTNVGLNREWITEHAAVEERKEKEVHVDIIETLPSVTR
ncbi:hypothetical protein HJC23_006213 [Cyclotella cryptica]|uniref:WW domain-containing protein n=1 Tax=Cyclotella cryptica TaxID=29204 RepID=A0ABD3PY75_9STRA